MASESHGPGRSSNASWRSSGPALSATTQAVPARLIPGREVGMDAQGERFYHTSAPPGTRSRVETELEGFEVG